MQVALNAYASVHLVLLLLAFVHNVFSASHRRHRAFKHFILFTFMVPAMCISKNAYFQN